MGLDKVVIRAQTKVPVVMDYRRSIFRFYHDKTIFTHGGTVVTRRFVVGHRGLFLVIFTLRRFGVLRGLDKRGTTIGRRVGVLVVVI